jgi:hypothetical protein
MGGGMCMEVANCKTCSTCTFGCGIPAANATLCRCNAAAGETSLDLYTALYECLCGPDGISGNCGAKCGKVCTGAGTDAPDCMSCLGGALNGACAAPFDKCKNDN